MDGAAGTASVEAEAASAGPADREHFLDAQARHRRRTWRAAVLGIPSIVFAGIPLCLIVTPLLVAPIVAAGFILAWMDLMPAALSAATYDAAHILPQAWSAVWNGTPVNWPVLAMTFVVPGVAVMLVLWLALRALLGRAWIPYVQWQLAGDRGRPPDRSAPAEHRLVNMTEELAVAAAVPVPKILILEEAAANATIVGHDAEEATLLVSRGLLALLDRAETQALLATLVASRGNGDLRIAATFFSVFMAWGALSLLIEVPFSADARRTLRDMLRAMRCAARGERDEPLEAVVANLLLDGAASASRGFDAFLERAEREENVARNLFVDLPLMLTAAVFSVTARATITLATAVVFGPANSALWRSRKRLADAGAVELTRQPAALARAVEKLHAADVELLYGDPVSFLFPWWPKKELTDDRTHLTAHVLGMQLDPHKRLQDLRRMGSGREVTIALAGWEGWRREIKEIPGLIGALLLAVLIIGGLLAFTLALLGAVLLAIWTLLESALVDFPAWIGAVVGA